MVKRNSVKVRSVDYIGSFIYKFYKKHGEKKNGIDEYLYVPLLTYSTQGASSAFIYVLLIE